MNCRFSSSLHTQGNVRFGQKYIPEILGALPDVALCADSGPVRYNHLITAI